MSKGGYTATEKPPEWAERLDKIGRGAVKVRDSKWRELRHLPAIKHHD